MGIDTNDIVEDLRKKFNEPISDGEKRKIIFWIDQDKQFVDDIENLSTPNYKLQILHNQNMFYTKYLLEEEDPESNYLIYTNLNLSDTKENWLLDTVLYSEKVYYDKPSIFLTELGIDQAYKSLIKKYYKFFDNKERRRKFTELNIETYTTDIIETAIISVLCNVKQVSLEESLKTILIENLNKEENKYYQNIDRFFDINIFWKYISLLYDYNQDKNLEKLFIHLVMTSLNHSIEIKYLDNYKNYIASKNKSNCIVFIDHWMNHKSDYSSIDRLISQVEHKLKIRDFFSQYEIEIYQNTDTFETFDQLIISSLINKLENRLEDYNHYIDIIKMRQTKHHYPKYHYLYEAILNSIQLLIFRKKYNNDLPLTTPKDMIIRYTQEYYMVDTYYRKFYVAYDNSNQHDVLKRLKPIVENLYTNWFISNLSVNWSNSISSKLPQLTIPGMKNQKSFYNDNVRPILDKNDRSKVFVIISDALRYEIAEEINESLNTETRGSSEIEPLIGVIPSITKLGMSILLPYQKLEYRDNGSISVDGKESMGYEQRKEIIEAKDENFVATNYKEFIDLNKISRREKFNGKKLIYIYHNMIDAVGDKADTEIQAFTATEKAIEEILKLINLIRGDLSGTNILITSDHGFMYQRDPLEESDKLEKENMSYLELSRRYMITKENKDIDSLLKFNLHEFNNDLFVYVPKSTLRFKKQGRGVNFVHGGASLQEMIIPLIKYKNIRKDQAGVKEVKKVELKLTTTYKKITNKIFTLNFFQTEKVEDKLVSNIYNVYFTDAEGNKISNEETIIADSTSDKPEERTFKAKFTLKSLNYNKNDKYFLILKNEDNKYNPERIQFEINLGIVNEFDF